MKQHNIVSSRLPEIADSVKECVNMGEWLLFKSEAQQGGRQPAFYLKTSSTVFELNDEGKVLHEVEHGADKLEIDELFYFSDIRKPISLSNMRM